MGPWTRGPQQAAMGNGGGNSGSAKHTSWQLAGIAVTFWDVQP